MSQVIRMFGLGVFTILLTSQFVCAQNGEPDGMREVPIYVVVEVPDPPPGQTPIATASDIVKTIPGAAVKIRGVTDMDLAGKRLRITVTPPQEPEKSAELEPEPECPKEEKPAEALGTGKLNPEPPSTLAATVLPSGSFEVTYTPKVYGDHAVEVTSAAGHKGETSFEVVEPKLETNCGKLLRPELEAAAKTLVDNTHKLVDALEARLNDLPSSPAKDEAIAKTKAFQQALEEAVPPGKAPSWIQATDHLTDLRRIGPEMRSASSDLVERLEGWKGEASGANEGFSRALADLTHGNVVCDQIDIIINGLKFCDFYLSLVTTPYKFFVDWAKENIPTKLIGMIPAVKRSPAGHQAIESAWKGIVTFSPTKGTITGADLKNADPATYFSKGYEFGRGVQTMLFDLSQFVANRFFEKYCQQFQGPISGTMAAEFYHQGQTWWKYTIEIQGQLTLRYPKDAHGEAIALTGEFTGNAMKFHSWDDIRVRFPEARGAVFKSFRREPRTLGDLVPMHENLYKDSKIAGQEIPNFNPLTSTLDKGGPVVKGLITPAFFRIPVRGDLRGDSLRLELEKSVMDFGDQTVKVTTVLGSVLSLGVHIVSYTLPYKDAHWILSSAMGARSGPVEFKVSRAGQTMRIERKFQAVPPSTVTRGEYNLTVKACNPGC